ncbi:hypothetical protein BT69DRAFT_1276781 [Atractiella rhizophila]|nr:hypothetical protein BT69DRAFT_1276781 [Atractiella rhizophila]
MKSSAAAETSFGWRDDSTCHMRAAHPLAPRLCLLRVEASSVGYSNLGFPRVMMPQQRAADLQNAPLRLIFFMFSLLVSFLWLRGYSRRSFVLIIS